MGEPSMHETAATEPFAGQGGSARPPLPSRRPASYSFVPPQHFRFRGDAVLFRNLKAELKSGRKLLGCWASLGNAGAVECAALGGFDVIVLDWEHGMVDRSNAL